MAKVTVTDILRMKAERRRVVMMAAYYYEMARAIDRAQPDMLLVGDSGAKFLLGHRENSDVTLDEMIVMTRSVARGAQHALVVCDMPFMTYQVSVEEALRNSGRVLKESGCDAVSLEGGAEVAPAVAALVTAGIPVLAHRVVEPESASGTAEERVRDDAQALQEAGAFAILLGAVPPQRAREITQELRIPTLSGQGSGDDCDGYFGYTPRALGWTAEHIDGPSSGSVAQTIYDSATAYIVRAREGHGGSGAPPIRAREVS